ncbi:MAG TPA: hypothetical protein VMF13_04600, partial [Luteitalea sp.]|nr:hypothetical protein [Luteitalea sp.]
MTVPVPTPKADTAVVLMLDPTDRQGYAGAGWHADDVVRVQAALRSIWPDLPHRLNTWRPMPAGTVDAPDGDRGRDESPYFTDARRLADAVAAQPYRRLVVVRPAVVLWPDAVLRHALEEACRRDLDVLTLRGIQPDILHIVSRRAMALVVATGGVPHALTVPQALQRLAAAGVALNSAALQIGLDEDVAAGPVEDVRRLPSRWWRGMPDPGVLAVPPQERFAWAIDADRRSGDEEAARTLATAARHIERTGSRPATLVCLPSMYQTGAHAAWAELLEDLSPDDVAFVVGGATLLHDRLIAGGFLLFGVRDGLAPNSASDMAVVEGALQLLAPTVVHLDGAECANIAARSAARGAGVVQHVRLNVVDRFRPTFVHADAVIGSSAWLCEQIATRVAPSTRVVHLPDGVRRTPVEPRGDA